MLLTTNEKLDLYGRFEEGSELGDAVGLLLDAASVLKGISCDHELELVMITAGKLIRDYMEMARSREFEWEEYNEIDPELYSYVLGGAKKLTEEQYNA